MVFHSLRHTSVTYKLNEQKEEENKITIPEGVDPELLMKVLGNPEMAALLTSLAKTMKVWNRLQSWTRMKDIITARMNSLYSLQTGNQSLKNNMEKIV